MKMKSNLLFRRLLIAGLTIAWIGCAFADPDPGVWNYYETSSQWGWRYWGVLTNETYGWSIAIEANRTDYVPGSNYNLPPHTAKINSLITYPDNPSPLILPDVVSLADISTSTCKIWYIQALFGGTTAAAPSVSDIGLPGQIVDLGGSAFLNCVNATNSLVFPPTLTTLESSAFSGCTNLIISATPEATSNLQAISYGVFKGVHFDGVLHLPTVKTISGLSFANSDLESIEFGDNLQEIAGGWNSATFGSCTKLKSVKFSPASNWKLSGGNNFRDCTGLTEIYLAGCTNITHSEETSQYTSLVPFYGCSNLKRVTFPAKLDRLPAQTFKGSGVEEVVFEGLPPSEFAYPYLWFRSSTSTITTYVPAKLVNTYNAVGTNWTMMAANGLIKSKDTTFAADFVVSGIDLKYRPLLSYSTPGLIMLVR